MVRVVGSKEVGLVTVPALYPERFKSEEGSRGMAGCTVGGVVGTQEWEAAALVKLCNVLHDPGFGGMAPSAVRPNRLVVHIGMAGDAFGFGFREDQGRMARPAIQFGVLAQ